MYTPCITQCRSILVPYTSTGSFLCVYHDVYTSYIPQCIPGCRSILVPSYVYTPTYALCIPPCIPRCRSILVPSISTGSFLCAYLDVHQLYISIYSQCIPRCISILVPSYVYLYRNLLPSQCTFHLSLQSTVLTTFDRMFVFQP